MTAIDSNQGNTSYEPFEDGYVSSRSNQGGGMDYDPVKERRADFALRRERLNMLRQDHARQRAMMAQRLGMMPRFDPVGGLVAPDYFDDGIINNSAPAYDSLYYLNKLPSGIIRG